MDTGLLDRLLDRVAGVGALPTDPDEDRLRKATLTMLTLLIVPLASIWVATYGALGLWLSASIPFSYQVLFADIVGFTPQAERVSPDRTVGMLNDLFSEFDRLAEERGLEKIKTIGDAYMVAGGLPEPTPGHAEAVAEMALDMMEVAGSRTLSDDEPVRLRIGIDSGPVVAGVIGRRKFIYDLWGDTVNTASRMESQGVPGCVQVTERTRDLLRDHYTFGERQRVQVKGKGEMATYFLTGRQS